jgi:hypothetical protein
MRTTSQPVSVYPAEAWIWWTFKSYLLILVYLL